MLHRPASPPRPFVDLGYVLVDAYVQLDIEYTARVELLELLLNPVPDGIFCIELKRTILIICAVIFIKILL